MTGAPTWSSAYVLCSFDITTFGSRMAGVVSEDETLCRGCDRRLSKAFDPVPSLGQSRLRRPTDTCKVPLTGVSWACVSPAAHQLDDKVAWVPSNQPSNEIALPPACIK